MPILPSTYRLKKALMYPYTVYKRRQENLDEGFIRGALEAHYYRPAFYRWLGAVNDNPELLYEADLNANSIVLDVGACFGEWAEEMSRRYDKPHILAFEPDPRNFKHLQTVAQNNQGIEALEYGLGAKTETVRMSLEFLGSTMFQSPNPQAGLKFADVDIHDIGRAWQDIGLNRVDLMKINIEGAEFPLLERMLEAGLTERVDTFLIQFHEWHPGAYRRRKHIQRELNRTHKCLWDHHFIWEKWVKR